MAITWRVPVLLALGLVPVLLRPQGSTVVLWLLVVLVLAGLDVRLAPRPRCSTSYADRWGRPVRASPSTPRWTCATPGAARCAGRCATPGSPPPAPPATGTGSTWPRARGPG